MVRVNVSLSVAASRRTSMKPQTAAGAWRILAGEDGVAKDDSLCLQAPDLAAAASLSVRRGARVR